MIYGMKEIRFRVFEKVQKVMLYDGFSISPKGDVSFYWNQKPVNSIHAMLMQSIGLVDCDKKEIYVGDIYTWDYEYDSDYDGDMPIVKRSAGKSFVGNIFDTTRIKTAASEGVGVKIIGNVYENPDLL